MPSTPRLPQRSAGIAVAFSALVVASILGAAPASAGLVFAIEPASSSLAPGAAGAFDVVLTNTDASTSFDVSTVDLFVEVDAGLTLAGITMSTAGLGYIFADPIVNQPGFGPFVIDQTATTFHAGDSEFAAPFFRLLGPGETRGVARVEFTVDLDAAPGVLGIRVVPPSMAVGLASNDLGAALGTGSVEIVAVPEPATISAAGTALACLAISRKVGTRRKPLSGE
ncbi:MAG: hypothetical protein SFX72_21860 [Isosphaeraceae bacterium]|nr:hypothetical protein [Isosphaeraceae bacterium]